MAVSSASTAWRAHTCACAWVRGAGAGGGAGGLPACLLGVAANRPSQLAAFARHYLVRPHVNSKPNNGSTSHRKEAQPGRERMGSFH